MSKPEAQAPEATPATQALLTETVDDLVRARLREMGIDPDAPAAPAAEAAQRSPRDPRWDEEARAAYAARPVFECRLAERHATYLRQRAAAHGQTPEQHLEGILRQFYATDTWRMAQTGPNGPGQGAGTSLRQ